MDLIKRAYLRIDPRSLGLFRILFGTVLIADLFDRWAWAADFYSNEGVLPNHNHLFILKDQAEVWSVFHSFSSEGEAHAAFLITLFFYACFTVGWYTRTFQAASLVALIGLCGRNVLTHSSGDSVAIALLAVTLFLPLGMRVSIDALRRSLREVDEKGPAELNDRSRPKTPEPAPSLAPLLVLGLLAVIYYGAASSENGETWKSGEAMYYALHVDRWTSGLGVALRDAGLSSILTPLVRYAPMLVVPLALVPVARPITRGLAILLMLVHGLTLGLLFTLGLYAWSLMAAAALLIPEEVWARRYGEPRRPIDVFYDGDCGVCLWSARLAKRLDWAGDITFHVNDPEELATYRTFDGDVEKAAKVADETMVVFDGDDVFTEHRAVQQVGRRAALIGPLFGILSWPGVSSLALFAYKRFSARRRDVSVALGLGACGIPIPKDDADEAASDEETPADVWGRRLGGLICTAGAALVVCVALAQTESRNPDTALKTGLSSNAKLVSLANYARVLGDWGVFAPDPPKENGALVVDATTNNDWNVDPITGWPPDLTLESPARARKGAMWMAYQANIADPDNASFRKEFRRYLTRGGHILDRKERDQGVKQLEVYWAKVPIPPPGEQRGEVELVKIFSQRGSLGGPKRRF